jgi:hypothetical protein
VGDEPDAIQRAAAAAASTGAGLWRVQVTHPLVSLGFTMTAVDESPGMLAWLRTVCSPIEALDLDERFDVVCCVFPDATRA